MQNTYYNDLVISNHVDTAKFHASKGNHPKSTLCFIVNNKKRVLYFFLFIRITIYVSFFSSVTRLYGFTFSLTFISCFG